MLKKIDCQQFLLCVCDIQLGVPVCNALLAFGLGKYDEVRFESFMPF